MQREIDDRHVVNVLTGFLGSGKTSLLSRLLRDRAFSRCAVLVNELGEIALDHELLERVDQETVVLRNGCICCAVREDMAAALLALNVRRDKGEVPAFDRVVVETTGLADPVPVLNTVATDATLRHHFRIGTVVTTVDAVLGMQQLSSRPEPARQIAVADRIVVTKADLVDEASLTALKGALEGVNAHAAIVISRNQASEADVMMAHDLAGDGRAREAALWFRKGTGLFTRGGGQMTPRHGGLRSVSLWFDDPLDWTAFGVWLSMLLHSHGRTILRVKGLLNLKGVEVPTVVHGVQHLLHPPVHLDAWPNDDRRSRLVLIGELPSTDALQASLEMFNRHAS